MAEHVDEWTANGKKNLFGQLRRQEVHTKLIRKNDFPDRIMEIV